MVEKFLYSKFMYFCQLYGDKLSSSMKILHKPSATVGQIIKNLEVIVAKSPDIFLEYSNDDGNE